MILRSRNRPDPSKTSEGDAIMDRDLCSNDFALDHEGGKHPSSSAGESGENTKGKKNYMYTSGLFESSTDKEARVASTPTTYRGQSPGQSRQEDRAMLGLTEKSGQILTRNNCSTLDMDLFDQDGEILTSWDWPQDFRQDSIGGVWPTIFSDCMADMNLREDTGHHELTYLEPTANMSSSKNPYSPLRCQSKKVHSTNNASTSTTAEFLQSSVARDPDLIPSSPLSVLRNPAMIPSSPSSAAQNSHTILPLSPKKKIKEENSIADESLTCKPTDGDVLLGRGGVANVHPGNARFRAEALRLRPWYEISSKRKKYEISEILIESVNSLGHRFLKKDDDGNWREVDRQKARKKASQALRERKKPSRKCKTMAKAA